MSAPPRLARCLLRLRLPAEQREYALGDLQEAFEQREATDRRAARLWYWRQALLRPAGGASRPPRRRGDRRFVFRRAIGAAAQDVRYGVRSLKASPALTIVATLTLALGIGASTAIYSLVDAILLQPLPFPEADRLVVLRHVFLDGRPGDWRPSFPDYVDYATGSESFAQLAAWLGHSPSLSFDDGDGAMRVRATGITWNLMPALGVEPLLGRGFRPEEDTPGGGDPVCILSYGLWRGRFGGDPEILGKSVRLDGNSYTVVGVMPRDFTGSAGADFLPPAPTDVWITYRNSLSSEGIAVRGLANAAVMGRLADGVTLERAEADLNGIAASLAEQFPDMKEGEGVALVPAHEAVVGDVRATLLMLLGAVGCVLLIACANVTNLLLGRTAARQREAAVRAALGAGRAQLIRQMLAEALALGLVGGALACALSWLLLTANRTSGLFSLPRLEAAAVDLRVVAFAAFASVAAALLFGIGPALHATRRDARETLRGGDRGAAGGRAGSTLRQTLVIAEVALSVVLLVGAGLLIRSFTAALDVDPGFDPAGILTARVQLAMPFVDEENWPRAVAFFEELRGRLEADPRVEEAAAAYQLPVDEGWNNGFEFADRTARTPATERPSARFRPVTPGYFELAGIELLRGRTFDRRDHADAPRVVIVNEAFVRQFFAAGEDPIGVRLDYGNWWAGGPSAYEIIGVVGDVRFAGRTQRAFPATYFPHAQQPVREMSVLLRGRGDPDELVDALRAAVGGMDPEQPIDNIATLDARLGATESSRRGLAVLTGTFAGSALLLAAVGVYGVMSFMVVQRTREIGIRLAVGARAADLRTMILRRGFGLALGGLLLGFAGAAALSQALEGFLFEVEPTDPVTAVATAVFLLTVAVLACWLPARRATRVDPTVSLRADV